MTLGRAWEENTTSMSGLLLAAFDMMIQKKEMSSQKDWLIYKQR